MDWQNEVYLVMITHGRLAARSKNGSLHVFSNEIAHSLYSQSMSANKGSCVVLNDKGSATTKLF